MVRDLETARVQAAMSAEEEALLVSPARPIVLVERRRGGPGDGPGDGRRDVEPPLADGVSRRSPSGLPR